MSDTGRPTDVEIAEFLARAMDILLLMSCALRVVAEEYGIDLARTIFTADECEEAGVGLDGVSLLWLIERAEALGCAEPCPPDAVRH